MPTPAAPQKKTPFALFVSSVPPDAEGRGGHAVSRYGTATRGQANELIGARRKEGGGIEWDPDAIVALTEQELSLFRREYRGAIADGALRERTEEEYLAWVAKRKEAAKKHDAAVAEAARKAAEAEKKTTEAPGSPA